MNRNMWKTTLREIKASFGRYLAIFSIIALGVGFFSGLKVTKETMLEAGDRFIKNTDMFDIRLISTLGLTDDDVTAISSINGVEHAYGAYQADAVVTDNAKEYVVRFHSIDDNVNKLELTSGRLPVAPGEAVADARYYSESSLGKTVTLSDSNKEDTLDRFSTNEFTIVGTAYSPLYLNYERGTSSVGNGSVSSFCFILPEDFDFEVYTDIYLSLTDKEFLYSKAYEDLIDRVKPAFETAVEERALIRYNGLYSDARAELDDAEAKLSDAETKLADAHKKIEDGKKEIADKEKELEDAKKAIADKEKEIEEGEAKLAAASAFLLAEQLDAAMAELEFGKQQIEEAKKETEDGEKKLSDARKELNEGETELVEKEAELIDAKEKVADAEKELADFKEPSTYVLTREENIGYSCFKSDSTIVDAIAVVFPVFFFLVAALVCVTTMSRMIEEQRTQIGTLKALGYDGSTIISKYMIYSGSAAITGGVGGFFLGCYVFPTVIWKVYGLMYGFTDIEFVFDPVLFAISIAVALICSVGTTYISCKYDLGQIAAELIRPKAPKSGKRILLERITFIWRKIPFLHKVSIRNVFRYKGRFVMMLLGIGGCTGLLVTGYGIRDSITEIADEQYTEIQVYDELVNFSETMLPEEFDEFKTEYETSVSVLMPVCQTAVDPVDTGSTRSLTLITLAHEEEWTKTLLLHDKTGKQLDYPGAGEVILSQNVAKINKANVGDTIVFRDSDFNEFRLKVSGICENYFNAYAYISVETYLSCIPSAEFPPYKSAFVCLKDGADPHEASAAFMGYGKVGSVSVIADTLLMFSKMMQTMNYIVVLVIFCAAALAFIVLYNLTNINITERIREIATIKVLGFYPLETAAYVFRENMALTAFGAVIGIPIGIWLHGYVMSNIKIDMVSFDVHINGISYIYALLFTFAFALFVDFVMFFKLERINMAESLKSIE